MSHASFRHAFIEFVLAHQILQFGEFTLKSGRKSRYFFNAGKFNTGLQLEKLGEFYAQAIDESKLSFDMLFGPAYKGIPLAVTTAMAMARLYHRDIPFAFDRKEVKEHGEGGNIVGAPLKGRVLIIDDVVTAGTAKKHAVELIRQHGAEPVGIAICLDRQERGESQLSAVEELQQTLGIPVLSIISLADIKEFLSQDPAHQDILKSLASRDV